MEKKRDFIKEVLEASSTIGGFKIVTYNQSIYDDVKKNIWYGKAEDKNGMTVIHWCTRGHSLTYFGEQLKENISISIEKDGGSRIVFNGYCFNKEDFVNVLKMTW